MEALFRVPARTVNPKGGPSGEDVWAFACGPGRIWCDIIELYESRYVDQAEGEQVWAYAPNCCEYPIGFTPTFVHTDYFPPHGISHELEVDVVSTTSCPNLCGDVASLSFDPSIDAFGGWSGNSTTLYYTIKIVQTINPPPAPPSYSLAMKVQGLCPGPGLTLLSDYNTITPTCTAGEGAAFMNVYPFRGNYVPTNGGACCTCPSSQLNMVVKGYCNKRIHQARFVDVITYNNKPTMVYAMAECCPPTCGGSCCAVYTQCTLHISLTSNCSFWGNQIVALPPDVNGGWTGTLTYGPMNFPLKIHVECIEDSNNKHIHWTVSYSTVVSGCNCSGSTQSVTVVDTLANCIPLKVTFPTAVVSCTVGGTCPCPGNSNISGVLSL